VYIDPSKTISAPYSQGNELIFGQNSGQQCVTMSLCSLIYNSKRGIHSANDLMEIMNIGNQLYSGLSQFARQSFLMQSELPSMLNVFETDYQLQYSWQFNIRQTLSLRFLPSPETGPTNLVSNNFEIFTLLKGDFCSVRLLHSKMLEKSPSSRSHASSYKLRNLE